MSAQHAPHDASEWVDDRDLGTDTPDEPTRDEPADDDFLDAWNADPDPDAWTDDGTRDDGADVRDDIPADAPIRDIAPDDFVARSSEQTFRAALKTLERETSRRESQYPRCPACGSINIRRKSTHAVVTRQVDGKYQCAKQGCRVHFDEPDPPAAEAAPGEQATLREVTRHD